MFGRKVCGILCFVLALVLAGGALGDVYIDQEKPEGWKTSTCFGSMRFTRWTATLMCWNATGRR